jgi:hypothetical protein
METRTPQNKCELVLLCIMIVSIIIIRDYFVIVMLFGLIPMILFIERYYSPKEFAQ